MNNFSIIIPVFNEEQNIKLLFKEILIALDCINHDYEIIFIDDFSDDNSISVIKSLIKTNSKKIKLIENNSNLGQSRSILNGVKISSYNTIVTIDADGQNNPKDIPSLLNKYFSEDKIFLVGGIRKKRRDSFVKKISSRVANFVRSSILKDNCSDTGCSLKVFDKELFMQFPFFNGIHRFLPSLFIGYGKKTFFINVDHRPRAFGYSKYGTYGRLIAGVRDLIKVMKIVKKYKKAND